MEILRAISVLSGVSFVVSGVVTIIKMRKERQLFHWYGWGGFSEWTTRLFTITTFSLLALIVTFLAQL